MSKSRTRKLLEWILFLGYIALLVYFVFFAESLGRTGTVSSSNGYRYNLRPLKEIKRFINNIDTLGIWTVFLNIGGNILAFVPFGYFLPSLSTHRLKFFQVLLLSFALSLSIEMVQLLSKVGSLDVDDLILNTLGGVVGYILFVIVKNINKKKA
jgi:glycopeptide antibiotics resistance protein